MSSNLDEVLLEMGVDSCLRMAQLDKVIEVIAHERAKALGNKALSGAQLEAHFEARYIRGLIEGVGDLCQRYPPDQILEKMRCKLGAERYALYFGKN